MRRLPIVAAILLVLTAYFWFASHGRMAFHRRAWDQLADRPGEGYYASLAEGFRRGQLSMAHRPDPALMAMPHPYDYAAREKDKVPFLWDTSYFNGRYFLYFSPLPALLVYLPSGLLSGAYPTDQVAGALFAAWAFLMATLFIWRAIGRERRGPFAIWILLLGLGGVTPFLLVYLRTYEVAALCGMAMTATWSWSLLRQLESPRTSRLLWTSIWLGLAIASRPNLGVLLLVAYFALPRPRLKPALIALVPLAIIGSSLMLYNYARFQSPFEFGHRYQLTYYAMADHRVCGCRDAAEVRRLVNNSSLYAFAPAFIGGEFPFVDLPQQRIDRAVSFSDRTEELGGIAPLIPLAAIGSLLAAVTALRREPRDPGWRAAGFVLAAGWLALLGLSSCWYVSVRYVVDFILLITAGAIVCIDRALDSRGLRAVAILLALYSVLLGFLLGFRGKGGAFANERPELFRKISERF